MFKLSKIVPNVTFLATSLLLNVPQAIAHPLDFRVHNQTNYPIVRLHISDSRKDSWEEDILRRDVLNPRQSTTVNFSGPAQWCLYDIKAVFSDGDSAEKYEVNLCKVSDFHFNP